VQWAGAAGPHRRGNALVLVSAILVLLVLLATAYLSRTQSQRATAAAMQDSSGDSRRVDLIKKQLASEIAMHLFVKPIDPRGAGNFVGGDSAGNRIPPGPYSVRYGVEPAAKVGAGLGDQLNSRVDPSAYNALLGGSDGFPDGFNFAPYSVIPWTNWPDFTTPQNIPTAGNPVGGTRFVPPGGNGNPLGNPGFGDTRWLRSTEPVRMTISTAFPNGAITPDGDRFSHWPHLSWMPTPANGWRVVKDIADIEGTVLQGAMDQPTNDAFGTPYEQWLPDVIPAPILANPGTDPLADNAAWSNAFIVRRNNWFTQAGYQNAILNANASQTLPNFIKLDDPMGIGRAIDPTKPAVSKSDEWIDMTPRNVVSRTFCDADGDGFTDSFWFLAPVGKERNVRTIVGVSVIDNASMVDLNVATRFDRRTTTGFTPSDLALVTSEPERPDANDASGTAVANPRTNTLVGLFDNPTNRTLNKFDPTAAVDGFATPDKFRVEFDPYRWAGKPTFYDSTNAPPYHDNGQPSFLQALGLRAVQDPNAATKVFYWNNYFFGPSSGSVAIQPATTEPFGGDMRDPIGPGGPTRPSQTDPLYRTSLASGSQFRYGLPNQPFTRPAERTRWFRSAATGQGTLFAGTVDGTNYETASDIFGIPVPTRRFDASDELALRAFAGNNDPSRVSRLERSLNADDTIRATGIGVADTLLRSTVLRGEAGDGQEQLTNPQLVKDLRHRITVVSGQRNEMMPPWLWIGRPYGIHSPDPRETFQNSMLWLGLHPESPGPRDENGNGRIDTASTGNSELGYGKLDLFRISTSSDPYQDGVKTANIAQNTPVDGRDWSRGVRYFETINAKLDLRRPLFVWRDNHDEDSGANTSDGVPDRLPDGSVDQFMAMTVDDQRLAMQDFVREARGRLRAALRIHSPMEPLPAQSFGYVDTEVLGIQDRFADYTDRFYEQFLFTTNTKTVGAATPKATLGSLAAPANTANQMISYRSAWSTEAMTASMAANIATWRSRPDLMLAPNSGTGLADNTLPLRPVFQPILPNTAAPYSQTSVTVGPATYNYPLANRAVDPSKATSKFDNVTFTPGSDPAGGTVVQPDNRTADIVFPGVEKHPFFTEVFFGWVYPATTTDDGTIQQATYGVCDCNGASTDPDLQLRNYRYVALVNGRIGDDQGVNGVDQVVWNNGNGKAAPPANYPVSDPKRDTLDKIRTPVLVVQVANPWNEPIRLGDFRINIFGTDYDFPDYELKADGSVLTDSNNRPVPLMLPPATETEPATATVYLIANVVGNPGNQIKAAGITNTPALENDMENVAAFDPLFRRRWLDYFDLFEYSDVPAASATSYNTLPTHATSPKASPLFPFTPRDPAPSQVANTLPRSKLLNAMQVTASGKKCINDLYAFKTSLNRDTMARGVTLQRVLKNPAAQNGAPTNLKDAGGNDITLEVDRFDGHSDFDHWSTTDATAIGGVPAFADERNADTNLITGGRFASAATKITFPPTIGNAAAGPKNDLPALLGAYDPATQPANRSYDGPGASATLFPPPTAKPLVRAKGNYIRIADIKANCTTGDCGKIAVAETMRKPLYFPGIILGEYSKNVAGAVVRPDGDYFTTWTHVSRNWSRLFDAKFVTVPAGASGNGAGQVPFDRTVNPAILSTVTDSDHLPVWNYTRQLVTGSFASNPLPGNSAVSRSPMIPVERQAPRFIFANRTEPEFTNRPLLMQPSRIEMWGLRLNLATKAQAANQATQGTTNEALNIRAQGDVFSLGFSPTGAPTPVQISNSDPDIWTMPVTWVNDPNYGWMQDTAPKPYKMLLTPVWAPLPDFCGMTPPAVTDQAAQVPVASWPTLVLRKPTSFNCQTVIVNKGASNYYPGVTALPKNVMAYYGNSRKNPVGTLDRDTKFVTPYWSLPPGTTPLAGTSGSEILEPQGDYRTYMADKGTRLLDQDGLLLPIDLASGGQVTGRPWRMRGLWNTLDRVPQAGSLQMLQKDDDFEQIGELLDVFAWGPAYRCPNNALAPANDLNAAISVPSGAPGPGVRTIRNANGQAKATFAEIMSNRVPGFPVGEGPFVNRIQVDPLNVAFSGAGSTPFQFGGTAALRTPYAPSVPWGMRIFDCFTVDGAGAALRFDWTLPSNSAGANSNIFLGGADSSVGVPDIAKRATPIAAAGGRPAGALVPLDVYRSPTDTVTAQTIAQWEYDRSPSLSGNFTGTPVKGLLNINTASVEALKTMPFMTQLVYDDTGRFDGTPGSSANVAPQIPWTGHFLEPNPTGDNPAVLLPSAMEIYRNQLDPSAWKPDAVDPMLPATLGAGSTPAMYPTYRDRGGLFVGSFAISEPLPSTGLTVAYNTGMSSQRGFTTVGEVIGLARETNVNRTAVSTTLNPMSAIPEQRAWSVRFAGKDPRQWYYSGSNWIVADRYRWGVRDDLPLDTSLDPLDSRLSTDRQGVRQFDFQTGATIENRQVLRYDSSYGDSEELNMLFKGISNLVTTRSDVFTVYFKVRTVKQNPLDGKWNGTDRDSVIDDARYVMCVDRTNVNRPTDQPRIVYFSRLPQ
jgi:hypothetical protein